MRVGGVLVAAVCAIAFGTAAAPGRAAQGPVGWCATEETATDRPDVMGGSTVHVVYAYPSDGVDRWPKLSGNILGDLAVVGAWWLRADPTRTPRFDVAAFGCDSAFGSLDVSIVRLPHPESSYHDEPTRLRQLDADLGAAGFADSHKKYLVYYDSPVDVDPGICGRGTQRPYGRSLAGVWIAPNLASAPWDGGCGSLETPAYIGGYTAIIAAHELLHTFGALDQSSAAAPPHACPGDGAHACDSDVDVMHSGAHTYWLDSAYLDLNHDDYYAHSGSWFDTQDSPWLRHADVPLVQLSVAAGAGGEVTGDEPCAAGTCTLLWDAGASVSLAASPEPGWRFVQWSGACSGTDVCSVQPTADARVQAAFAKIVELRATGLGVSAARGRLTATLRLNARADNGSVRCAVTGGLRHAAATLSARTAACRWTVPAARRGRTVTGSVVVDADNGTARKSFRAVLSG